MANSLKELLGDAYKDDITIEEIEKAILPLVNALQGDVAKQKAAVDKATSEASNYKKQLDAHQTEDEKVKAEEQKKWDDLVARNQELEKELNVSKYEKKYLAQGYDETLAHDTAIALAEGNTDKMFANEEKFLTAQRKKKEAEDIDGTPQMEGGISNEKANEKPFSEYSYDEREKLAKENPTEYNRLVGNRK